MITNFHLADYRFLSNFSLAPVKLANADGGGVWTYPSVEHAFNAAKTIDLLERREILNAATPAHAKQLGRKVGLRSEWSQMKDDVMLKLLRQKFWPGTDLAALLLDTGVQPLVEGNTWGDIYWGMVQKNGTWVGQNKLGRMLMDVRRELLKSKIHVSN